MEKGCNTSVDELMVAFRTEIHAAAQRYLENERPDHTLQPTALVNEAYLRLVKQRNLHSADGQSFIAAACNTIRRVLIDHARRKRAQYQAGRRVPVTLSGIAPSVAEPALDLLAVDEAIAKLEQWDPRAAQVVLLRFYSGLTEKQIAKELGVSERTVADDWLHARAWLYRQLKG